MSSEADRLPDLSLPPSEISWRERLTGLAESLDMSLGRMAVGLVLLCAVAVIGWRLLAPSAPPPEMTLPLAAAAGESAAASASPAAASSPAPQGDEVDNAGAATPDGADGPAPTADTDDDASEEVVVHVAGEVHEPGVQHLGSSARLIDAVEAAGGPTGQADLDRVNLAAELSAGQHIYLPARGEEPPELIDPSAGGPATAGADDATGGADAAGQVNVNTAGLSELETLPGIGPSIGQAILDHRDRHGPFASIDQLTDVRGIGDAKLEGLLDHATV